MSRLVRQLVLRAVGLDTAPAGRRLLSVDAKAAAGAAGGPVGGSVIGEAATARLKKIKSQLELSGELPPEPTSSVGSTVLRYAWNTVLAGVLGVGSAAAYYTWAYDAKDLSTKVREARASKDAGALTEAWCAAMDRYLGIRKDLEAKVRDFTDPTYHKLLPDLPAELRGRVKTLVLDLDDLLVHKEWTRQKGWTIYKRPGVQDFILEMGQYYEVVVFTDEPNTYADPIINRLDAHKAVAYRLYRPETQYHNGKHVRDLSKLNRDLSQVLMISADPDAWQFQPENTLKLQPWKTDASDTTLLDLIPFLQMVATRGVKDVREVVKSYDGVDNVPKAFRQRIQLAQSHQQQAPKRVSFLGGK